MERVTIVDLAKELGLAKSAVSYALNDMPGVSEETRARVKQLAQERGWRPSSAARALSGGKADAIGIVLNREPMLLAEEPWYQLVVAGVEDVLIDADISLMLRMTGLRGGRGLKTYESWAQERRVDGVLVFDGEKGDDRLPLLKKLGLPAVLVGFRAPGFPSVSADGIEEARLLVSHMADGGAQRILHLSGPKNFASEGRRRDGMKLACDDFGLEFEAISADFTFEGGSEACGRYLDDHSVPDAIICSNDLMSLGALTEVKERGLAVPDDVRIASWDDSTLTRTALPGITALDRKPMELGRAAARLLLGEIAGEDPGVDYLQSSLLVVRQSS